MPAESKRIVRLAAITHELRWEYRTTCSNESFNLETATAYIEHRTKRGLELMSAAAKAGAELVLGPEYFCGSEAFMTTGEVKAQLAGSDGQPALQDLCHHASSHQCALSASWNSSINGHVVQAGFLVDGRGELAGRHIKHNSIRPGSDIEKKLDVFDLDIARTGMLICADVTDDPQNAAAMASNGMELLLVPGVGFSGQNWRHMIISRAIDIGCPIVYSDTGRALIVSADGKVAAEVVAPESFIVADVEIGCRR
ncbi:MAG: carbon-nitrogen hydrolase family protein [Planctomycetota bacterium]|jgi:predicted amidohydrolase|nr:carbon-nitrogen hydrolase family protein [Planctomycetota bacterium]MDP7249349.1 carbon-nitrogen hydrolase family protein [Planctomycetota bacterium]